MQREYGEKVTWICFWGNGVLTAFKAAAGLLGHSTAMIADAVHSASDVLATGVALVSLKIAKKPKDESHPYGHGKAESIASGFIGLLLLAAGLGILVEAILHIRGDILSPGGIPEVPGFIALLAAVISIVVKEAMYQYTIRAARRLNSPAMAANAWDHRSDALSSIAGFIGIGLAKLTPILGFRWLAHMDAIAGGSVALFIMKMAYDIIRDACAGLMDASVPERMCEEIRRIASEVQGVKAAGGVRARHMGAEFTADVQIVVDSLALVVEGHRTAVRVKEELMKRFYPHLTDVMIHVNHDNAYQEEKAEHAERAEEIAGVLEKHCGLHMGFHHLSVHAHGSRHFVEFHLLVPPDMAVGEAHRITEDLEGHIRSQFPGGAEVNIHVEPWTRERAKKPSRKD